MKYILMFLCHRIWVEQLTDFDLIFQKSIYEVVLPYSPLQKWDMKEFSVHSKLRTELRMGPDRKLSGCFPFSLWASDPLPEMMSPLDDLATYREAAKHLVSNTNNYSSSTVNTQRWEKTYFIPSLHHLHCAFKSPKILVQMQNLILQIFVHSEILRVK